MTLPDAVIVFIYLHCGIEAGNRDEKFGLWLSFHGERIVHNSDSYGYNIGRLRYGTTVSGVNLKMRA